MTEPFDRERPSPIGILREFYARGNDAVVPVEGMTAAQDHAYVPSTVDERLALLLTGPDAPHLAVISGSAGFGKSALISRIERDHPGVFEAVVQDATHAESPSQSQAEALVQFFAPFADDSAEVPRGTRVIAANTGMIIQFFRQLAQRDITRFSALEAALKSRLGLWEAEPPATPWRVVVLNLDLRPTAGESGLLRQMLHLLDFSNREGLLGSAPRCETCRVRDHCPVLANSVLAARSAAAIDKLAQQAATERGRHAGPRQLYDLAARVLTGNDPFDGYDDPCDAVANAAEREDRAWVSGRLLPTSLFALDGELGTRLRPLDPSLFPSASAHDILTTAGLRAERDAARISALGSEDAPAFETAAEDIRRGTVEPHERGALARSLVAAEFLREPEAWDIGDRVAAEFRRVLETYNAWSIDAGTAGNVSELARLMHLVQEALARAFGVVAGGQPFLPIHSYDPRDPSRIFVNGTLTPQKGSFELLPDPPRSRDPEGSLLAGHEALAVTARVGGVELAITLPLYRLLRQAAAGTLASTADLERFYALRHAVEALARRASEGETTLMVERPGSGRHYLVSRFPGIVPGQETYSVQEVGR
jgi:hypothetical protein